ncbi:UDP-Glycosyltransferase superfamily protein [Perilla frutescens var. hirtella]|uniref:UDP-Glycosyltransferase superfamily protein n=1 Tax=Perilla frutescens var. hirtella TaxID=608512 RepID=A0AAD4IPB7_PERFH|nr:UDP-Glycosyltransferase superfamily protein [Perilla frutescens var. hirtella]
MVRLSPLRPGGGGGGGGGLKSPSSGKSTPRGSPSFRRLNSGRTPRREGRGTFAYCFRSNRIVLWLLLITLWAYAGFYFQSRWAHGDNKEDLFSGGYGGESNGGNSAAQRGNRRDLIATGDSGALKFKNERSNSSFENVDVVLAKSGSGNSLNKSKASKKRSKKSGRSSRRKSSNKLKFVTHDVESEDDVQTEEIPKKNTTYGFLVGPFGTVEDSILEWSPEKRSGTCDRKGAFARLVWSRKFVLIFHELTMTGAPLAMLELATEFLSCGATISVIVLNKKGTLMPELTRRKIKVLEDKTDLSFKTAMRANLIIAGSAVCSSWIEQYLSRTVLGTTQIMWWIMENRREYFDRSKHVLNRVKKLIFLSELQSKQWLAWCEEENIQLKDEPALVPLSVNDELAFAAGISCSLNTPTFTTEKMLEKRQSLRSAVRHEMGLTDDDMLAVSLSSINPGKGQLLLMESARLVIEEGQQLNNSGPRDSILIDHDYYSRALLHNRRRGGESSNRPLSGSNIDTLTKKRIRSSRLDSLMFDRDASMRKMLSQKDGKKKQNIKILIGSVGSKSNKVLYVKALLTYLSTHSNLSKSVLWTPATTRVASLYAAADVYVMNSQGIGETFGRVTIEAMAFGLPVLGTDSGGTIEIVEHNVTGLLHPLGRPGSQVLARNLEFLLENTSARQEMGMRGREKVEKMYLKKHMFQKFGEVLYKCMRIK